MTEPKQKPGRSKQDYGTPPEFLDAVKQRLGIKAFGFDFAADNTNTKADHWWTKENNALGLGVLEWLYALGGMWGWLNPEFSNISPWAKKCDELRQCGGSVALLVPAGVGSNWFRDYVHGRALVLALNGRLTFEGCADPYPKDCILALYGPDIAPGFDVWTWKPSRSVDAGQRKKTIRASDPLPLSGGQDLRAHNTEGSQR